MKQLTALFIFPTLLLLLFPACNDNSTVRQQLADADSLIMVQSDSAVRCLAAIDASRQNEHLQAYHALLLTKAMSKVPITTGSDSLIAIAADYFYGRGDSLEVQALYYQGELASWHGHKIKALVALHDAYEKALATNDYFFAAMSARELTDVYAQQHIYSQELKWAKIAKKLFIKAGKRTHENWMNIMILRSLRHNDSITEAIDLLNRIETSSDPDKGLYLRILREKAELQNVIGNYADIFEIFDELRRNGYRLTAHDNLLIEDAFLNSNNVDSAISYHERLSQYRLTPEDSIYAANNLSSIYLLKNDLRNATLSAKQYSDNSNRFVNKLLTTAETSAFNDYLNNKLHNLQITEKYTRRENIALILICFISVISLIFAILYFKNKVVLAKVKVDNLLAQLSTAQRDIEDVKTDQHNSEQHIDYLRMQLNEAETKHKNIEQSFRAEIKQVFSKHIELINEICSIWYRHSGENQKDNYRLRKEVIASVERLQQIDVIERLTDVIAKNDDRFISKLKELNPKLTKQEYLLSLYLYLDFNTETISVLLNKRNISAIYAAKHRLKHKLLGSPLNDKDTLELLNFD